MSDALSALGATLLELEQQSDGADEHGHGLRAAAGVEELLALAPAAEHADMIEKVRT